MKVNFPTLLYRADDGSYVDVGDWAIYLMKVGALAARWRRGSRRLVIGLSVPTRAFASPFCALGCCLVGVAEEAEPDLAAHFQWLAALPRDTLIRYPGISHLHCGRLLGTEVRNGIDHISYIDNFGVPTVRPWDKCGNFAVAEEGEDFVRNRLMSRNPAFVSCLLDIEDPYSIGASTTLDSLVVGIQTRLRVDAVDEEFAVLGKDGNHHRGNLNDVIRFDVFGSDKDHYRSMMLAGSKSDLEAPEQFDPTVVIFDDGYAFLRARNEWSRANQIVVFDRSSAGAATFADGFMHDRAVSIADVDCSELGPVPDSIEISAYEVAVK